MNPIKAVLKGKNLEKAETVERMLKDPGEVAIFEGELTRETIFALGGAAGLFIVIIAGRIIVGYAVLQWGLVAGLISLILLEVTMAIQLWYRYQTKAEYRRRKQDKPSKWNGVHG
ncbi:hypothetical protein KFU94_45495 [Chloroflexi bacterium TSY]|nr:hypothetical protein [Chloroflexi bacterium TSY]